MAKQSANQVTGFSVGRLNGFTDGVLAIVITLLVLGIDIPEGHKFSEQGLITFLLKISRDVLAYAASFLLIAAYWVQHNVVFQFLRYCNRSLMWFNILFIFPLTLAPVLTKLKVIYRDDVLVVPLFGSAFIVSSLILTGIWRYAVSHPELLGDTGIDPSVVRSMQQRIMIGCLVCLIAVCISFLSIDLGTVIFCTLPLFYLSHRKVDINLATK